MRAAYVKKFLAALALTAANSPTTFRAASLPAGLSLDARTGVLSGTPTLSGRRTFVITAENAAGSAATVVDLAVSAATAAPVFTVQPKSVRTTLGANITLFAAATGFPKPTYTWLCRGQDFCNTTEPVLELTNLTAAYAGDFTCVATNSAGSTASVPATVSFEFSGLVNISARASVGTGANVVIPGITIRGTKPKTLLIRAAGPALGALGVTDVRVGVPEGLEQVTQHRAARVEGAAVALRRAALRQGIGVLAGQAVQVAARPAEVVALHLPGRRVEQIGGGTAVRGR